MSARGKALLAIAVVIGFAVFILFRATDPDRNICNIGYDIAMKLPDPGPSLTAKMAAAAPHARALGVSMNVMPWAGDPHPTQGDVDGLLAVCQSLGK